MKKKQILLGIYFICCLLYIGWRAAYTLPLDFGVLSIVFGLYLFLAELVGFIESTIFYYTLKDTDTPTTPVVETKDFPDVDVFVATYNEAPELLYKTIIGCKNMAYPDNNRVHIYICDDGKREEIAKLCDDCAVGYISRSDNTHAKAGNLNNALLHTDSPYIVTFDADMIPMSDFLIKSIPFFIADQKLGFVQIPQNFYNLDPFQYNLFSETKIPNEQQLFSRFIQAGRSKHNAVIYAGSNTVISRQALLEVGGFAIDTITEDFATGMLIQSRGYNSVYLNEVHASGLSPESLEDLYNQRIRWGRGVVQTFKKFNPFRIKGLNLKQKLMYASSLSYWYFGIWRLIFLCAPILFSLFGIVVLSASALPVLLIWGPMFVMTQLVFKAFTKNVRTTIWSHLYDTILFPHIAKGVLLETIGLKMTKFNVTPKDNITRDRFINKFSFVKLQIALALMSLAGIGRIAYSFVTTPFDFSYLINFFWLVYNFYLLAMAIVFACERPKLRSSERIRIDESAHIIVNGKRRSCRTFDISEQGISLLLDQPAYVDPGALHEIAVYTKQYQTRFDASLAHIDSSCNSLKYAFRIQEIDKNNLESLMLIIYDRVPAMPELLQDEGMIKNILAVIKGRRKRLMLQQRKLPRIPINREFIAYAGSDLVSVNIEEFNYQYCAIKSRREYRNLIIPLDFDRSLQLNCSLDEELSQGSARGISIYKVSNFEELVYVEELIDLLLALDKDAYTMRDIAYREVAASEEVIKLFD